VGLERLVARSEEEYIELAAELLRAPAELAELRRGLRARIERSALMDAPRFARGLEAAFRSAWRSWCERSA
jgi:predicted O-linked N-acetylglucosamine transferase (SPINDLY family)